MEGGGPVAAMQAERAAIQLSPRNEQYALPSCRDLFGGEKLEALKRYWKPEGQRQAQIAAVAREKLGQISNEQKYGVSSAPGSAATNLTTQKSPFDALVQDAAERAAAQTKSEAGPDKRPSQYLKGKLVSVELLPVPRRNADHRFRLANGETFAPAISSRCS